MGLGSSLSGISFGGISSGLDTDSIISRLMQLEAIPIQRLQQQQARLTQRQGLLGQFKSRLTAFSTAAGALNVASNFNPVTASSSDEEVAKISTTSGVVAGIYRLEVSKLAQSHKLATAAQTNASSALNLTGSFTVNGKGVAVTATDTLTTIAQKINGASAGVSAGIIDGGTNNAYLTLTASSTGTDNKIQIGDLQGSIASTLGLVSGAKALREPIAGGATSSAFTSSSANLGSFLNSSGAGNKTFNINGTDVTVDLDTTTLQGVANAINAASAGAVASVRSVTVNGATQYKLDVTGLTSWTDADNVLEGLGVVQRGFGNQLVAAQNAEFKLDGVSLTNNSNTVTSVIPGATITLLKADVTTPKTSTLSMTRDNSAVKTKVKEFSDAYNALVQYVKDNTSFDKETFAAGGLFGDSTVAQVESSLASALFNTPTGLTGTLTNLTQIGFGLDSDGKITVDDTKLDKAIAETPDALGNLFRAIGSSTNGQISYLASTTKSKASGASGYLLNVTQASTKHTLLGDTAQTSNLAQQEILTFNGALFGNTSYDLILDAGMSQAQILDRINTDAKLKDLVTASVTGGILQLETKKFGTPGVFTVASNRASAVDQSGLGTNAITVQGVDVAGTLNGETLTGSGQMLTGAAGNANTEGLQLLYTGSATGNVGNLVFTKGVAAMFGDIVSTFTDATNGVLTSTDKSISDQIDGLASSITDLQARLSTKQQSLRIKFTRMEEAISKLQSQQQRLAMMRSG